MDFITILLGFVLSCVIGLTGVGGGALAAPALFIILDLPYSEAIGTSLVYAVLAKALSIVQHVRQGTVEWRLVLIFGLWGIPSAIVGSLFLHYIGTERGYFFPLLLGALLLLVAFLLVAAASGLPYLHRSVPLVPERMSPMTWAGIGIFMIVVGTLIGVTSVGSGSLIILSMVYLFSLPARVVVGTNMVIALIMIFPAATTHLALGGVSSYVLGLLVIGSIPGAFLGSRATIWMAERTLQLAMALVIAVSAIATLAKVWWEYSHLVVPN